MKSVFLYGAEAWMMINFINFISEE